MQAILSLIFIFCLLFIFYQDIKERKVSVLLFFLGSTTGTILYFKESITQVFLINILLNLVLLSFITFVLFLYTKLKLEIKLAKAIGLGDFLFFIVIAVSFPVTTFLILFSSSLVFSLVLYLLLKPKLKYNTVPLAGLQALFLSAILILNWIFTFVNLYAI